MDREPGYYWVKLDMVGWLIFFYNNSGRWISSDQYNYQNSDFAEINENRIKAPDENT